MRFSVILSLFVYCFALHGMTYQLLCIVYVCRNSNNMDGEANEKYVKLHLDIMTHHSRVQTKVEESLRSIKAKVGFVPREVEDYLKELKDIQVLS